MAADSSLLLEVHDLRVHFPLDEGTVRAVDGLSYSLDSPARRPIAYAIARAKSF